jgi:hypothetical protein
MLFLHFTHIAAIILLLAYCLYLVIEAQGEIMNHDLKTNDQLSQSTKVKLTWKEYQLFAGFYKFFLDFGLKANVFFYGITGAILTILYNRNSPPSGGSQNLNDVPTSVKTILLVTPFLIGIVLAMAFIVGAVLWRKIVNQVYEGLRERDEKLKVTPYLNYLTWLLISFGVIFVFVSCCLCYIMWQNGIFDFLVR